MGCDIRMYAEVKKNGKWEKVGRVFKNPYYANGKENQIDEDGFQCNPKLTDHPYERRNYDLFAMLANVRNGRGTAGCDTGDGFIPIAPVKGLPIDVSQEVLKESDDIGYDGHSHSWLTLEELLGYDWMRTTKHRGFVDSKEYAIFKKEGKPRWWCGDVGGGRVFIVGNETMDGILLVRLSFPEILKEMSLYTKVEWSETYKESAGDFITETIPALQKLGEPEDVRIVFWFDN